MNCVRSLELLSEFNDKALDDEQATGVSVHLTECLICAEVFRDMVLIVASARVLRVPEGIAFPDENALWQRINLAKSADA